MGFSLEMFIIELRDVLSNAKTSPDHDEALITALENCINENEAYAIECNQLPPKRGEGSQ